MDLAGKMDDGWENQVGLSYRPHHQPRPSWIPSRCHFQPRMHRCHETDEVVRMRPEWPGLQNQKFS